MIAIDPRIFRAYDIRGKAHSQLSADACRKIAHAFGNTISELYNKSQPLMAVGRDARTHSPKFEEAVVQGLMDAGCYVLRMGQTPSPVNYFTICQQNLDGGIQITASHNPKEDNGLKLQVRNAEAFSGNQLQRIRERIEKENLQVGTERLQETIDATTPYLDFLENLFAGTGNGKTVVVDCGNGVTGPVYAEALKRVGCTVIELYTEPDGNFPNHPADPSKWETLRELQEKVKETNADLGFGFDGDGDRVGLVDETGEIRTADEILLLLARDHLSRHAGATVIFTVSMSGIVESEVKRFGGKPVICKVGHSFVEHAMHENKSHLGGEQSGHFFCGEDYYGYDDALVAALRILSITSKNNTPLSQLFAYFPKVLQAPELRPHCPDDQKFHIVAEITNAFAKDYPVITLDGVRIDFGDSAWAGIRASNTSPCLSICMEARSDEKLKAIQEIVLDEVKKHPEVEL